MTITTGWWIVPLVITIVSFLFAEVFIRRDSTQARGGYGAALDGVFHLIALLVPMVVSLVSWLVWALMT